MDCKTVISNTLGSCRPRFSDQAEGLGWYARLATVKLLLFEEHFSEVGLEACAIHQSWYLLCAGGIPAKAIHNHTDLALSAILSKHHGS